MTTTKQTETGQGAGHTPTPWSVGRTLETQQTRRWTREQIEVNNRIEGTLLFSNFLPSDQGRSREKVAIFVGPKALENAKYCQDTLASHAALTEQNRKMAFVVDRGDELERVANRLACCKTIKEAHALGSAIASALVEYREARAALEECKP